MAQRNYYRNLAIEYYARNSSTILAITHQRWPRGTYQSQPQLARYISLETGGEVDYRSLSRQLRRVRPDDPAVTARINTLIYDPSIYPDAHGQC